MYLCALDLNVIDFFAWFVHLLLDFSHTIIHFFGGFYSVCVWNPIVRLFRYNLCITTENKLEMKWVLLLMSDVRTVGGFDLRHLFCKFWLCIKIFKLCLQIRRLCGWTLKIIINKILIQFTVLFFCDFLYHSCLIISVLQFLLSSVTISMWCHIKTFLIHSIFVSLIWRDLILFLLLLGVTDLFQGLLHLLRILLPYKSCNYFRSC